MSSQNYPIPPVPASPPTSGGVRRHHTITAASRSTRNAAKEIISEEAPDPSSSIWQDDEPVDQDWVGGVGAVGEKTSLHRQASLPTRYHRAFHGSKSGTVTPKTVNSLAAIAGHEGDEEPWNISSYGAEEPAAEEQVADSQSTSSTSPQPHSTSPPPGAGANVRRHVSLTAAAAGPRKIVSNLKRSGTLQTPSYAHQQQSSSSPDPQPAEDAGYTQEVEEQNQYDEYYDQNQTNYPASPMGRQSPWSPGSSGSHGNEWRANTGFSSNQTSNTSIDDVQRALSTLELASNNNLQVQGQYYNTYSVGAGQSVHPPRFNPSHPPPALQPGGPRYHQNNSNLKPIADFDGRKTPLGSGIPQGGSAGGSYMQNTERMTGGNWDQQEGFLRGSPSNSNLRRSYHTKTSSSSSAGSGQGNNGNNVNDVPDVPPIPAQYLPQPPQRMMNSSQQILSNVQHLLPGPIDVPTLISTKGYNPVNFDTKPVFARYFVIKSYTEDDVHKSLKYEIWSSTDPGNKRLDKAFKETAGRGPIYLFYSVNASGHFCGMAEMITPVDYTRNSTVWASDKWKGVFKVKWVFVRDIPNATLRHIKLNNTQERKPVTNSRDTQELLPDAGQEMLRIFHTHPSRTSLLQDYAFYELQALQRQQAQQDSQAASPNPSTTHSTLHSPQLAAAVAPTPQQPGFGMPYQVQLMMGYGQATSGMGYAGPGAGQTYGTGTLGGFGTGQGYTQGGQGYGAGQGNAVYGTQQTQTMHQSVMRNTSPGPSQQGFTSF